MLGTGAIVGFPSGAGVGVLSGYVACKDCKIVARLRAAHAVVFGATNVPEFAASVNTANPASGQTRNPYDHTLTPGGSSGGAASAVAMGLCALAVSSEDTGGSTRIPALCNGLFGFDPARNHYSNGGNSGMTYTCDQAGVLARAMEDLLLYDSAVGGAGAGDAARSASCGVGWQPWLPECSSPPRSRSTPGSPPRLRGVQTPLRAAHRGLPTPPRGAGDAGDASGAGGVGASSEVRPLTPPPPSTPPSARRSALPICAV